MADEKETASADEMTADETAFFESGGEKEIPSIETPAETVEKPVEDQTAQAAVEGAVKVKTVPHETFHAEREEHKKTKAELAEMREFKAKMEERWQWVEALNQQPKEEDTPPDPNVDVFAALKWTQDKLLEQQKSSQEAQQKTQQQQQEQQAEQQVWTYWQQDAATYTKENPDFGNAATWLSDYRDKQLAALSAFDTRFATPQARNAQIERELKDIVITAAQQRRSPAQLVYELAKGYGYAGKTPEQADPGGAINQDLNARIDQIDKAQTANRTVGTAPGGAGGDEMTAEALASMPEQEFAVWMAKPENAAKFRKLMA